MMQQIGSRRQQMSTSKIKELENRIKREGLKNIHLKELIGPDGYAKKIVEEAELTRVQLRKLFNEFKSIYQQYQKGANADEIKVKLYQLYPLLQYQVNRNLIKNEEFKDLIFAILDKLDENLEEFRVAMKFLEALIAYIKRD